MKRFADDYDYANEVAKWELSGAEHGWVMPSAPRWKRLPIIRHIRAVRAKWQIERWYSHGPGSFGIRTGYDEWVVFGMLIGKERRP